MPTKEAVERRIEELKSRRQFIEDHGHHREVATEGGYEVEEVWEKQVVAHSWRDLSDAQKFDQITENTSIRHLSADDRVSLLKAEVKFERLDDHRRQEFFSRDTAADVYDPSQYAHSTPPKEPDRGRSR
jgi:hypothetical protein